MSLQIRLSALSEPPTRPGLPVISRLFSNLSVQEQQLWFGSVWRKSEGAAGSFIAAHEAARAKGVRSRAAPAAGGTWANRYVTPGTDGETEAFATLKVPWVTHKSHCCSRCGLRLTDGRESLRVKPVISERFCWCSALMHGHDVT